MEAWCCIAWRLTGPSLLLWGRGVTGGNVPNAAVLTLFSLVLSSRKTRLKIAVCRTAVKVRSAMGRFLPVAILSPDRPLLGESGHWDAGSKSHIHDIRERLLSAKSRPSSKEFICSVRPSLNDRFRLEADGRVIGRRQAAADP